jgi:hypothetical protein
MMSKKEEKLGAYSRTSPLFVFGGPASKPFCSSAGCTMESSVPLGHKKQPVGLTGCFLVER